MSPKQKGELAEQICISELMKFEVVVAKPIGDNQRYDLIIDLCGKLYKAQVKTGHLNRTRKVWHRCYSVRINSKQYITKGYVNAIDVFLIYCPDNNEVWVTPIENATVNACMAKYPLIQWIKDKGVPNKSNVVL